MPYYAQENGQVEVSNMIIIGLIKRHVGQKPRNRHKTLDQALLACQTSHREPTKSTPFGLTFGHDAVLYVKIYLQLVRIQRQFRIPTNHYWKMILDELIDLDE